MRAEVDELECDCCGEVAAVPDDAGMYYDGQPLMCGCEGQVVIVEDDGGRNVAKVDAGYCPCQDPDLVAASKRNGTEFVPVLSPEEKN